MKTEKKPNTAGQKADEKKPPMTAVKGKGEKPAQAKKQETGAKVISVTERIQAARQSGSLANRWDRLQDVRKQLDSFKFGSDDNQQELIISDGDREFRTTKTEHCETVVTELLRMVDGTIDEVEAAIAA